MTSFYVKHTPTGRYGVDGTRYIQNTIMHPIKQFSNFADAKASAKRLGWGWIVTRSIRIGG